MSIEFTGRKKCNPDLTYTVPVATHEVFRNYWSPICDKLDFVFVPLFETGIPIAHEDLPQVLDEIERMIWYLQGKPENDVIGDRIVQLRDALLVAQRSNDSALYIG